MLPSVEDTPAVLAYRMGQVEIAVKEGFLSHEKKLDALTSNFASKEEIIAVQARLDNMRWYFRAMILAILTALATAVGALMIGK